MPRSGSFGSLGSFLGAFSSLVRKLYPLPFSLTSRHINEVKQNEYPKNLSLQIVVLDADSCSSVSKTENLLFRPMLRGGLWGRAGKAGLWGCCRHLCLKFKPHEKVLEGVPLGSCSLPTGMGFSFGLGNEGAARPLPKSI